MQPRRSAAAVSRQGASVCRRPSLPQTGGCAVQSYRKRHGGAAKPRRGARLPALNIPPTPGIRRGLSSAAGPQLRSTLRSPVRQRDGPSTLPVAQRQVPAARAPHAPQHRVQWRPLRPARTRAGWESPKNKIPSRLQPPLLLGRSRNTGLQLGEAKGGGPTTRGSLTAALGSAMTASPQQRAQPRARRSPPPLSIWPITAALLALPARPPLLPLGGVGSGAARRASAPKRPLWGPGRTAWFGVKS